MNVKKEAKRDAFEAARAEMSYGEGAGTRRKLINASVEHKIDTIPGYEDAFYDALDDQNMNDHAKAARKERRTKDVSKTVGRNVRGLVTGNRESLSTGVAVIVGAWWLAHQTGYDKKIEVYAKAKYRKVKAWVKFKRAERNYPRGM